MAAQLSLGLCMSEPDKVVVRRFSGERSKCICIGSGWKCWTKVDCVDAEDKDEEYTSAADASGDVVDTEASSASKGTIVACVFCSPTVTTCAVSVVSLVKDTGEEEVEESTVELEGSCEETVEIVDPERKASAPVECDASFVGSAISPERVFCEAKACLRSPPALSTLLVAPDVESLSGSVEIDLSDRLRRLNRE